MVSGLLRISDAQLALQEALVHTSDPVDVKSYWSVDVVAKAQGHLIGVALVHMPVCAGRASTMDDF